MTDPAIASIKLKVGLEIHVELATHTKIFSRVPNPAAPSSSASHAPRQQQGRVPLDEDLDESAEIATAEPAPNTLIDPVVLGLPGALPVLNRAAVDLAMVVGLALNCSIASRTKWDRKSYFYPDLPKAYQISQYDLPLCFDGSVDVPLMDDKGQLVLDAEGRPDLARIGIIRAHLEEDAGKLLHEAPGGRAIDDSIVDWNRAGTPLLEIVTQPDFDDAARVVSFARQLQTLVRFLGASEAVLQRGHMRFEPNINCLLTLADGRLAKTPIVEVKNLNSFRALRAAIEYELAHQPRRWLEDRKEMGPGAKTTRGWDDATSTTFVQREKEDAHDYRYFPDPDLPPVVIDAAWLKSAKDRVPELPLARQSRYVDQYQLGVKEAAALVSDQPINAFYESTIAAMMAAGLPAPRAGKLAANYILQSGLKRANERSRALSREVGVHELGLTPAQLAEIAALRESGKIASNSVDELIGALTEPQHQGRSAAALAEFRGLLITEDPGAIERWVDAAIAEQPEAAADVKSGKAQAVGRLVGAAMKHAAGKADAKTIRDAILKRLAGP